MKDRAAELKPNVKRVKDRKYAYVSFGKNFGKVSVLIFTSRGGIRFSV